MENLDILRKEELTPEQLSQQERADKIEKLLESIPVDEDLEILEAVASKSLDKVSKLYERTSNYGRTILSAVIFAFASHGAFAQESKDVNQTDSNPSYETFVKQKEQIKEVVGYDIEAEAKKVNRKVVTSVLPEKPEIFTIVNLGQTHDTTQEQNWNSRKQISRSQKEIAKFLSSVSKSCKTLR